MVGLFSAQSTAFLQQAKQIVLSNALLQAYGERRGGNFSDISSFAFFNARFEATVIFFDGVCAADAGLLRRA